MLGEGIIEEVIEKIKNAKGPLNLDFSNSGAGDVDAALFAEAIKLSQVPLNLNLKGNEIGAVGACFLAEGLKVAQVPISLDLDSNIIGAAGARFLAESLEAIHVPVNLYLCRNNIGEAGAKFFAESLKVVQFPISLGLGSNGIGEAGVGFLAESLKAVQVPINLNLSNNSVGEAGAECLAESLKLWQIPISLNLTGNRIMDAGARFFAESLKLVQVPITLSLADNGIREAGAELLARSLKVAQVPLNLDLSFNIIEESGASFFAASLKEAQVQLNLDLSHNNIGEGGAGFLAESLKEACVPIKLGLNFNNLGDTGAGHLAQGLKVAKVPINLSLRSNLIGEVGAELLSEILKVARTPISLDLSGNDITGIGAESIADAKKDNFVLDAGTKPLDFLSRIEFGLSRIILEQKLGKVSVLATMVQEYIGYEDLAWIEVAAIRAIENVSHDNKYSSINYELLIASYFPTAEKDTTPGLGLDLEKMVDDEQEEIGPQSSVSASSLRPLKRRRDSSDVRQSLSSSSGSSKRPFAEKEEGLKFEQVHIQNHPAFMLLNLLLSISRIKAVSNRLEIPQDYIDVPGDGLCFYHAIARQLVGGPRYGALELQQMAINEIVNHLDRYEGFAAQYDGDLNGFLNYHLQRQESEKGGWADNIMIQAMANALERIIEVQLFDRAGNAIGAGPIVINPQHLANLHALRLGNIDDLHFVAREIDADLVQVPNATSTMNPEVLVFGDGASFEFGAEALSGLDSAVSNSD
jgi:Ran GTPase-activating protein (RanGAP) involved in mRNA processing and transport